MIVTADDFLFRSFDSSLIICNSKPTMTPMSVGEAYGDSPRMRSNMRLSTGENFDITVVVDSGFSISLKMEWVNHVDIIKVCGCSLVGQVDWVMKGRFQTGKVSNLA